MVSFVIPVKDEEETIETLCAEIVDVAAREKLEIEIVFVDDGSTDSSWSRIAALAATDRRVRGIRLRRNCGKAAALAAGFARAGGDPIVTLDADLQDDPRETPRFLRLIDEGYDMVSGWKRTRYDPWHKVWPSRVFNRMVGRLTGLHLHDHVCGFKCCRAEVARSVALYGEMHRFFAVRAFALGYKVTEIEVHHRPREHGRSKYGVSRFVKGFLDLLTTWFTIRYGRRPMHFFGTVGLVLMVIGAVAWGALAVRALLVAGRGGFGTAFWTGLMAVLFGLQWIAAGLLAEARLAAGASPCAPYGVAETVGFDVGSGAAPPGPACDAETCRE